MNYRKMTTLSIVIPTYNEEKDIGRCINSLLEQKYLQFEIIVVDDGSTDKTGEIVKNFQEKDKRVKLIGGKHKGPGVSRNLGAKVAKGRILVFVDADMRFEKDYLENLIAPIIKSKVIGTTHQKEIAENLDNIWSRCWGKATSPSTKKEDYTFRAILREKFLEMGGFDPKYGYADDKTFWIKYGIKSVGAPGSICYHHNPETLKEIYRQSKWIGASIDNFWFKVPILKYFSPFFMIILYPIAILPLSLMKCYKKKSFKIFFPWMLTFMIVRYFGTIKGIFNKIYLKKNLR